LEWDEEGDDGDAEEEVESPGEMEDDEVFTELDVDKSNKVDMADAEGGVMSLVVSLLLVVDDEDDEIEGTGERATSVDFATKGIG